MEDCGATFLKPCIATLEKYSWTRSTRPVRALLVDHLRRRVVVKPPTYPMQLPGWAHKPRLCGQRSLGKSCEPCDDLNRFLAAIDRVSGAFTRNPQYRQHIQALLPTTLFQCSTERPRSDTQILHVQKLGTEYQVDVRAFWDQVKVIEDKVLGFRGDYV